MKSVLVTGANKGIGRAIALAILEERDDTFVFVGSRSTERGEQTCSELLQQNPAWEDRLGLATIDVSSDASVDAAKAQIEAACTDRSLSLFAIVNNAGVGLGNHTLEQVLQVNTLGVRRVSERFAPLLPSTGGRIVNITSAAGPNFVNACQPERQTFFCNPQLELSDWQQAIDDCLAMEGDSDAIEAAGFPALQAYGLSKAFANSYTMIAARLHPGMLINACTPGFIETDMTRAYAEAQGKEPSELGMKPPKAATKAPLYLLFGQLQGNGRYYGSDALRSPIDRYRSPGDPPFVGD